jgi:anti-sigma factor RsiW
MKPCSQNRKLIVCLTLNTLAARQTRRLREHLETCEGCSHYLAEISNVTEKLAAVEFNSNVQASERFHSKVAGKLRSAKPDSLAEMLLACFRGNLLNRRMALPAIAILMLVGIILVSWPHSPLVVARQSAAPPAALVSDTDNDLAPTIANYQRAADQSLEKLDALLTRQSKRSLPPMPIYTVSTLTLAKESF